MSRVLHRTISARPPVAVAGQGLLLTLSDGRRIIDGSGGAAVACIGHGNARVAARIADQASRLAYAHTGFFSTEPAEALADLLVGDKPGGLTHAFFVSSGSEAMEAALKLGRQYFVERGEPQRVHFISRRQSYHGNLFGTLAASGHPGRRAPYEAILPPHFSQVSSCFAYRAQAAGESEKTYVLRLADELEGEFQRVGPDRVIGVLAEPVVGALGGCIPPVPGYFRAIREVCDRHGALLILDEIMCGMGRTGTTHAWQQEGIVPDIQAVAKGLAGGYQPIGAMLVSARVIAGLDAGSGAFVHGHTYQAHPVACAAAHEVQTIIAEQGLVAQVRANGAYLGAALHSRLGDHPHVGDIRGRGLFWALEFVADRASKAAFAPIFQMHERIKQAALERGLAIYPTGGLIDGRAGDNAIVAPPFTASRGEIDQIVEFLAAAIDDAVASGPVSSGIDSRATV
jgi:adenosylmethionine-8-amino-7-oxononanoate aminotransferase